MAKKYDQYGNPLPKKKKHIFGKIILFLFLFILIAPIAIYFIFIMDMSHSGRTYREGITTEKMMNEVIVDSFDTVAEDHKLHIALDENSISSLIHESIKDTEIANYIPEIIVDSTGEYYDFVIYAGLPNVSVLATKVTIRTSLNETEIDGEEYYEFAIKDIKLGRLGGVVKPLVLNVGSKYVNDEIIEDALSSVISIKSDLKGGRLLYKKSNLLNDLQKAVPSSEGFDIMTMLQLFFENDLFKVGHAENKIQFDVDLEKLGANSEYVEDYDLKLNDGTKHNNLSLSKIESNLTQLIADNPEKEANKTDIFYYLFNGYEKCNAEQKAVIDSLDFSSIAPFDKATYKGFELGGVQLGEKVTDLFADVNLHPASYFQNLAVGFDMLTINETDINSFIQGSNVLGFNFVFDSEINGVYKTSYICLDNFYCNIYDEHVEFVVGLNMNGYETTIILSTEFNTANSKANFATNEFAMAFDISGVKFGSIEMPESVYTQLFDLLGDSLGNGIKMQKNAGKYTIVVDFADTIKNSSAGGLVSTFEKCNFSFYTMGANKEENGALVLRGQYAG